MSCVDVFALNFPLYCWAFHFLFVYFEFAVQTLAAELETVRSQKLQLESELSELREVTNHQVEQYVTQVMAMGQQLQQLIDEKDEAAVEAKTKEHQLSLELEKEKGRLTGL